MFNIPCVTTSENHALLKEPLKNPTPKTTP